MTHEEHDHSNEDHHGHGHSHGHSHGHDHGPGGHHHHSVSALSTSFGIGIVLNSLFVAAEFFYGHLSGSIALIADAGHNLQDVFALALSALALWLAGRPASRARTYGYKKGTILAALTGSILLVLGCGMMIWEACGRLGMFGSAPAEAPASATMMWVAAVGVAINLGSAALFFRSKDDELNSRAAYVHLLGDAILSGAVVVTGFVLSKTGWAWLDPAVSIAIALSILFASYRLLVESLDQAIDGVPRGIDPLAIETALLTLPGVRGVHHLHIWGMSTTEIALTAHLKIAPENAVNPVLRAASKLLGESHGVSHVTLQIEHAETTDGASECVDE